MKIAIIDNYDSFTYNLHHYLAEYCAEVKVFRNDEIEIKELQKFDGIVISPGPGLPVDAGKTLKIIDFYKTSMPLLGICLGHQAIGEYFGAKLRNLNRVLHGVAVETEIMVDQSYIFDGLKPIIDTGRYHSWVVDGAILPDELKIIAMDKYGEVQGLQHRIYDIIGLQFHPESVMTKDGKQMIENWTKHVNAIINKQ